MNLQTMPIIRLELDRMKASVMTQLGHMQNELATAINEEVEKAVANYPFEAKVAEITHACITDQIENYFRYGAGRDCIADAVNEALDKIFKK